MTRYASDFTEHSLAVLDIVSLCVTARRHTQCARIQHHFTQDVIAELWRPAVGTAARRGLRGRMVLVGQQRGRNPDVALKCRRRLLEDGRLLRLPTKPTHSHPT